MDGMRVFFVALGLAVAAAGCVTETRSANPSLVWKDGAAPPSAAAPGGTGTRQERDTRRIVELPEDLMDEIRQFVNRERILVADRIEIDASRIPFHVSMVPVYDESAVEKVQLVAPELKATGMLLRSRVERPLVPTDFPKLRVGDGLDLVATREIQVRTYANVDVRRPVWIRIQALGHAVYRDVATGRRVAQDAITIEGAAVPMGERLVFRQSVN